MLEKLVELYDLCFREGRAQSAPATRTGASEKVTIAEADARAAAADGSVGAGSRKAQRRGGMAKTGDQRGLNSVGVGCGPRLPHNEL